MTASSQKSLTPFRPAHKKSPHPRIALVCDWLTTPGGAEKVLLELHHMYPSAPIYTSQYRPRKITWFHNADVRTGWLNLFPACFRKILGPLRQFYFSHLNLSAYDLVISVTGAEAKAVKTSTPSHSAFHLCYCHVPTQYYWRLYDKYLQNPGFGPLNPLARLALRLLVKPLRRADYASARRVDQFVTISSYAASAIQEYYGRESIIISPPVEIAQFSTDFSTGRPIQDFTQSKSSSISASASNQASQDSAHSEQSGSEISPSEPQPFYVIACRQAPWKRIDLAISACQELGRRLIVIGDGAEHKNLLKLAQKSSLAKSPEASKSARRSRKTSKPKSRKALKSHSSSSLITFLPWLSSRELIPYLQSARAYLFPSLEPFGIAAVEALAAGCPVIAYAEGGSRDIVQPGKNGLLFSSQTPSSLAAAITEFEKLQFSRTAVSASADRFSAECFRSQIKSLVDQHLFAQASSPDSSHKNQPSLKTPPVHNYSTSNPETPSAQSNPSPESNS